MCGRYTLSAEPEELARWFDVPKPPTRPRYNVAPRQVVAVGVTGDGGAADRRASAGSAGRSGVRPADGAVARRSR